MIRGDMKRSAYVEQESSSIERRERIERHRGVK